MSAVARSHGQQNQTNWLAWSATIRATKQPLRLDISEAVTTTPDDIIESMLSRTGERKQFLFSFIRATVVIWMKGRRKKFG